MRTFKGIDTISAMVIQVKISDFKRFATAKAFCTYLGLTLSEQSSGDKVKLGSISKQGNSVVRSTLIKCARALLKGNIGFKSQKLKARQSGRPNNVIDYADRTIEGLQRRYSRLLYRGKIKNKAVTAIARELAYFIWEMSTGNIQPPIGELAHNANHRL